MNKNKITNEVLAAFLDGNTTPEETMMVLRSISEDQEVAKVVDIAMKVDEELEKEVNWKKQVYSILPIQAIAALGEQNLCDIECEKDILRRKGIKIPTELLTKEAERNRWKKEEGMPLYNMGKLLEQNGLRLFKRFNFTMEEIRKAIENGASLIAVISAEALTSKEPNKEYIPDHAVVVLDYHPEKKYVLIYDPQSKNPVDIYNSEDFERAWNVSKNYIVMASQDIPYEPRPIDTGDVVLDPSLIELREEIAENAHETWAFYRRLEGWTYGPVRNDDLKQHPDMVRYADLPEREKLYDRELAMQTLKLIIKFGYEISKKK